VLFCVTVEKPAYPSQYTTGVDNNGMVSSYSTNYQVEDAFGPDSPFYPFSSGTRRIAGPPQVPGNVKRKKEVIYIR
jgi:hypothetical protein